MHTDFWELAKLEDIWISDRALVRRIYYSVDKPLSSHVEPSDGFGFYFYDKGIFDLKLQGKQHIIDPTCLIFNHDDDEWQVHLHQDEDVSCTEVLVDEKLVRDLAPAFGGDSEFKLPVNRTHTTHHLAQSHQRLLHEIESVEEPSSLLIESLMTTLCADMMRHLLGQESAWPDTRRPDDDELELIDRAKSILVRDLREDISLNELAAQLKISPYHFLRLFKKRAGQTPLQYLTQERINFAKKLLLETSDGIMEISLQVGYQNPSHFSALFRRHAGLNPREFRSAYHS
jgi:AraC-like DNA-binding protein